MSTYELLLFLHFTAVIIWLGASSLILLLLFGARSAGDREREIGEHRQLEWLAPRLFIPASLSSFVFGVLLVIDGPWSFDQLWIVIGLVGWAISFGLGFFYFKPEGERIASLADERGMRDAELEGRLLRVSAVDRVQVLTLFAVVADMVLKPTGDDTGILVVGGAILVVAAAWAALATRGRATPAET